MLALSRRKEKETEGKIKGVRTLNLHETQEIEHQEGTNRAKREKTHIKGFCWHLLYP